MRDKAMKGVISMAVLWLIASGALATERLVPDQYQTIQAAIDDCNDGDTVIVGPGIYTADGNRDIDFGGKAITIRSTDPNDPNIVSATVIDCSGTPSDPHRGFYFHNGEDANSTLDGLTVTNGYQPDEPGGAIYCKGSSPTVRNCIITANWANSGGGVGCDYGSPTIANCVITKNVAQTYGGGVFCLHWTLYTGVTIDNCTIERNSANSGAGIYCEGTSASITGSTIFHNTAVEAGGGVYCDHTTLTADRCTFMGNSARNGGGVYTHMGGNIALTSCMFAGNSADNGAGLYLNEDWSPQMNNCTVAANAANSEGGGIFCGEDCYLRLGNSILWANVDGTGTGQAAQIHGAVEAMFSCIQDEDPNDQTIPFSEQDDGNIDDDPMFVREPDDGGDGWGIGDNDDFGDLHLQNTSPCINAGFPSYYVARDSLDIDGQPRVTGLRVDMGADEAAPIVVVTKPQGGEVWKRGSTHEVQWSSYGLSTLNILFSEDGGSNWVTVEGGLPDTGSYFWHLPDAVDSNQCSILLVPGTAGQNAVTIQSGLFTIHPDSAGPTVQSKWKSLGGDFDRAGLSENFGPELGCIKWRFETDGAVSASVTVSSDDRIHIASEDGTLYTLDANGLPLWSHDTNSPFLSSPTIGLDGTVYVGSENGKLYAIDINGSLRWTHTTGEAIYSSPAVSADGNSVYVGSQDGVLYALNRDGSELWTFATNGPGRLPTGSILASPAIGTDGTVYIGGLYDPNLYALDPNTGALKWKCSFKSGGWPFASPVIAQDGTIYQVLLYDPNLYAIEPDVGAVVWATNLADPCSDWFETDYAEKYWDPDGWSEPALGADGTIYVSLDDPYLRAVGPGGDIRWVTRLGEVGGFTLTVGSDGLIYAASDDGYLCVVGPTGKEIARFRTDRWLNFPVIAADDTIIVGDSRDDSALITDSNNAVWAITRQCDKGQALDLHRPYDLDGSGKTDFHDLAFLAADWLGCTDVDRPCFYGGEQIYLIGDANRDFYVGLEDLVALADHWLKED